MSKCANCPDEAVFRIADPGADEVLYCRACLPAHMVGRGNALVIEPEPEPEPEPDTPKKKK